MIKTVLKLAIAALIVHACWRAGTVFLRYYNFKDEVQAAALFGGAKSEGELQGRVMELATQFGIPLAEDHVTIRKEETRTVIDASYTDTIEIVPRYFYPWEFTVNVEALTFGMPKAGGR
jgi:hypothetical protein